MKILVLTDHDTHNDGESIYPLLRKLSNHESCNLVDIASRSTPGNNDFFQGINVAFVLGSQVKEDSFHYLNRAQVFGELTKKIDPHKYDVIFLRIDRPISSGFLNTLETRYLHCLVINSPNGIAKTSQRDYILKFEGLCPPMAICRNIDDVKKELDKYPLVLKPLDSYGGKGIVKIDKENVELDGKSLTLGEFFQNADSIFNEAGAFLSMKYLSRVSEGDKRIIVCNQKIIGSVLRMPREGDWLCNISQGGISTYADVEPSERKIIDVLNIDLAQQGIVLYGIDTLINDDGDRVLSEINTVNVGGLFEAEYLSDAPVIERAVRELCQYIKSALTKTCTGQKKLG